MKLYQIKENPLIKCNKEIKEYLDADYIYIPYDKDYELKIKNHDQTIGRQSSYRAETGRDPDSVRPLYS